MLTEFIYKTGRAKTQTELAELFLKALEQYGYDSFHYRGPEGADTEISEFMSPQPHLQLRLDWYHEYIRKGDNQYDVLSRIFTSTHFPFSHHDLLKLPLNSRQKRIVEERESLFSEKNGDMLFMPINSFRENSYRMALCAFSGIPRTDPEAISTLYAICNQTELSLAHLIGNTKLILPEDMLTAREKEVLKWCAVGKNNNDIGEVLHISHKTVEDHMHSIFKKLGVSSRTAAALIAKKNALID